MELYGTEEENIYQALICHARYATAAVRRWSVSKCRPSFCGVSRTIGTSHALSAAFWQMDVGACL